MSRKGMKKMVAELPSTRDKLSICAAEVVGTGLLLFFGCMGCVTELGNIGHVGISLGFGLTVMFIIQSFGHISGAHLNPAVTVAAVIFGNLSALMAPLYFVAQFVGAVVGFLLLKLVTPMKFFDVGKTIFNETTNSTIIKPGVCTTMPHPDVTGMQAMLIELLATGVLVFVCCAVWDHRNSTKHDSVALKFGFTVTAIAMVAGPYTGGSMNPARSFAPALINNDWHQHWVYWVGPLVAAVVVTGAYNALWARPVEEDRHDVHEDVPLTTISLEKNVNLAN